MFNGFKLKKIFCDIRSQWPLKIYVDPKLEIWLKFCMEYNPIKVNNFAYLFVCTTVGRASD